MVTAVIVMVYSFSCLASAPWSPLVAIAGFDHSHSPHAMPGGDAGIIFTSFLLTLSI
jgi:hypothetical protein